MQITYHEFKKHGQTRTEAEKEEERIDDVAAPLFSLLCDFQKNDKIPNWAKKPDSEYLDGSLLSKAKQLLL